MARVAGLRDGHAQHEGWLSGSVRSDRHLRRLRDARSAVSLQRRRARSDHAAHHEMAAGQPHALGCVLCAGSVDPQQVDVAGRAALRARVELLPRGVERPVDRQRLRRTCADVARGERCQQLQRHRAALGNGVRRFRQRQDGHQGEPVEVLAVCRQRRCLYRDQPGIDICANSEPGVDRREP